MNSSPLSSVDRDQFRDYLRRVAPLDDADCAAAEQRAHLREYARGESMLTAGERAVDCGNVLAGVMREYYPLADGREVTRGFAGPGDGVGSLSDLLSGEPARSSVTAETDVRIAVVAWAHLRALASRSSAWERFVARITEGLYLLKAAREYELLALDAEARYLSFRERFAAIESQIALRQVASYVGITPEHLSRLRRRLGHSAGHVGAR